MIDNVFFFLNFKNNLQFFYDTLTLKEALFLMKEHGFSAVPVIDERGVYAGSVSEGDFLWYILEHKSDPDLFLTPVSSLIRKNFMPAVSNSVTFDELVEASLHQNYVPVVDDRNIFIGIVTRQTLINYMKDANKSLPILLSETHKKEVRRQLSTPPASALKH